MIQIQKLHESIHSIEERIETLQSIIEDKGSTDYDVALAITKQCKLQNDLDFFQTELTKIANA